MVSGRKKAGTWRYIMSAVGYALVLLTFYIGCGKSPQDSCKEFVGSLCEKLNSCNLLGEGESVDSCKTRVSSEAGCDRENPTSCAKEGKKWDVDNADKCTSEIDSLSCSAFRELIVGERTISSCENVCK